jgi:DNA processing protein
MTTPGGPASFELRRKMPDYPEQLLATPDPPRVLYGIGDPAVLVSGIAIIGARRATPYGLAAARLFASWAASSGYTVVSGGAVGCDQAAHRAALATDGKTVAVLGCGADVDYPREAGELLDAIRDRGAVVSERPWGAPPTRWAFSRRNRIIAGLSAATLVVEASLPSGTFSTADHAADAGRDVYCVPGSIFAPECRGSNRLIRQGATPITDVSELASALDSALGPPPAGLFVSGFELTDPDKDPVLRALLVDPMRPDDLAHALALDIVTVARHVGSLEARGLVARYPDGRYGPC